MEAVLFLLKAHRNLNPQVISLLKEARCSQMVVDLTVPIQMAKAQFHQMDNFLMEATHTAKDQSIHMELTRSYLMAQLSSDISLIEQSAPTEGTQMVPILMDKVPLVLTVNFLMAPILMAKVHSIRMVNCQMVLLLEPRQFGEAFPVSPFSVLMVAIPMEGIRKAKVLLCQMVASQMDHILMDEGQYRQMVNYLMEHIWMSNTLAHDTASLLALATLMALILMAKDQ